MKNAKPKKKTWREQYLELCEINADLEVRLNDVVEDRDMANKEIDRIRQEVAMMKDTIDLKGKQIIEMQEMLGRLCAQVCREKALSVHYAVKNKEMPF